MVIRNVAEELGLHFRMAIIHAEIEKEYVNAKLDEGKISPLGPVPDLTREEVDASVRIVGQMGVEPFVKALEAGAQVIVAVRSAAVPRRIRQGAFASHGQDTRMRRHRR